jgi:hypothetical protein
MFIPDTLDPSRYVTFLMHSCPTPVPFKQWWCQSEMIVFSGTAFW